MSPISGNCSPEWRQLVSYQADGELDEFDSVRLSRHLADCPACAAWADEVSSLSGLIRSTEHSEPDRALAPLVLRHRRRRASFATASAASVAVAAAVAAFVLQLPAVVGHAGNGGSSTARAESWRWSVAHRAFLKSAFVQLPATSFQRQNPVASA
jgi:anti-sigma factor RsiW